MGNSFLRLSPPTTFSNAPVRRGTLTLHHPEVLEKVLAAHFGGVSEDTPASALPLRPSSPANVSTPSPPHSVVTIRFPSYHKPT
ncbi:hypothetical protein FPOAC2_07720 [Fusarium poae]|uniref:hypothetical protein n=1 Tax=Fusarium poae TaxID=36050 RepID=UPI001CEB3B62|nr:hypothetical protein FPOAC1_007816 [Fusarium poae]KAG8668437.1 hypothetical protein FPOAC1_007816 [Fusarium poae]